MPAGLPITNCLLFKVNKKQAFILISPSPPRPWKATPKVQQTNFCLEKFLLVTWLIVLVCFSRNISRQIFNTSGLIRFWFEVSYLIKTNLEKKKKKIRKKSGSRPTTILYDDRFLTNFRDSNFFIAHKNENTSGYLLW